MEHVPAIEPLQTTRREDGEGAKVDRLVRAVQLEGVDRNELKLILVVVVVVDPD